MRWLLHGSMTPAVGDALKRHEHTVVEQTAINLSSEASPAEILKAANTAQLDILTTDSALVNAPFDLDLWFQRSIVYLHVEGGDVEQDDAIDRLFDRYKRLTPGRLYSVTGARVKVRQLPGKKP